MVAFHSAKVAFFREAKGDITLRKRSYDDPLGREPRIARPMR